MATHNPGTDEPLPGSTHTETSGQPALNTTAASDTPAEIEFAGPVFPSELEIGTDSSDVSIRKNSITMN